MKAIKISRRREINWIKWFRRELIVMFTLYFFCANMAFANPYGASVVNGNVSINKQGNNLTVTNSPNSIINWQGFSIASNEAVRFIQQSSQSSVLNRVIGQNPSAILGALQSNGRVFLINPNGILFGQGAQINVNGLVASTLNISNQDFLAGKYNFTAGINPGSIQNQGTITTPAGGKVYLIAPDIENSGIINTPKGDIILAAGHSVQLVDSLDPDIAVVVSAPGDKAVNLGQIMAQSGRVGIYGGLIQQKGIVSADSAVVGENGKIFFKATKDVTLDAGSTTSANGIKGGEIKIQSVTGTTLVSGAVTAIGNIPAPSTGEGEGGGVGKGGDIQVLGQHVGLIDNARIDASGKTGGGTVLIGGDYQGKNPAVQNAEATYVGKDTAIKADAIETGDGGKVIVWSDKATRVYGVMSAKGGMDGGNGGFIETSSKQHLDVTQAADASAPNGNAGTWLLDPNNITVVAGAFGTPTNIDESPTGVFNTNNDGAQITNGTITQALNAGTSVSLTTGTAGSNLEAGDITVNAAISKTAGADSSITLTAANNININQSITSTVGKLDLNLTPTAGATNLGAVTIDLFGGTMTATAGTGTVNFSSGTATINSTANIGTLNVQGGALSLNSSGNSIASLNLTGGTLTGSGALTLSGASTWSGGTISVGGSGGVTALSGATLTLSGNNDKILSGGNLTIAGQAEWTGAGNLHLDSAGQFTIQSGGLFDIKTDADIHYTAGGVPTFTNAGILRKSAGTDVTVIGASIPFNFVNSGTLDAQTGILNFAGNNTFSNGSTFTGAGINRITTGAAFSGAITSANLDLAGGTFSGTATLSGATNWSGGTIGGNAVLTIPSGSALNMVNAGYLTISNATLIDQGTITWPGAGDLYLDSAGQFTIQSGGLFDIRTDADIHYTAGGIPTFTNAGILRKSAGTDVTVIGASNALTLNNAGGAIEVTGGSLQLNAAASFSGSTNITGGTVQLTSGGGSITGSLNIGSGATMDFASGTTIFTGTTDFTGSGSLLLSGATWSGSGNVNVSSPMTWTGGTISVGGSGGVTVLSGATLALSGSNDKILSGGNLTIAGQAEWTGAGNLHLDSAGQFTIQSGGLFDIRTDADIHYTAGGPPTFTNAGILRKSAGTDVTVIGASIPFSVNNSGAIDVLTGTIDVTGTFSSTGTIEPISGATFTKTGGFINSGTIGGMGTIDVGAGNTLTNNGTINPGGAGMVGSLAITGNLVQGSSGIINIDIAGTTPGMQYDQLTVSGSATLNGTLNIAHVSEYTPSGGETFNVINSAGNTGSFATINPPASFTYTPTYGATVFSLAFSGGLGTDSWLLNADGSWDVAENWSLNRVPSATDLVVIAAGGHTITVSGAAFAQGITSNENLTIAGGSLSLTAGAYSSLFSSGTTLSLTGGGTITIGSGATLTAYNLNLASGDISGPGSLTVSNSFSQSTGGTIGNTMPVSTLNITQAAGNLVIADLLKASGNVSLTAYATTTQTGAITAAGLELLGAGGTYNLNNAANSVTTLAGNTGSVNFTNISGLSIGTVNATAGLTTSGNTQVVSGGDLTLSGLIDAGTGTVSLFAGGAIINGMGGLNSISASSLVAVAQNGIGSGNPLMTSVQMLSAINTTINDIAIDNTGVLAVIGLSNEGSTGNVILQNIGAITTSELTVTAAGGSVSITAHSPLTIGAGGVSASGDIALAAAASGGSDGLTINGNIASANGNIALTAGSSIAFGPGAVLSAPHGTITLTDQLNGSPASIPTSTLDSATTGNATATNGTEVALQSSLGTIATIIDADKKEDEDRKKKKEGGEKETDEKKMDSKDKKYCN